MNLTHLGDDVGWIRVIYGLSTVPQRFPGKGNWKSFKNLRELRASDLRRDAIKVDFELEVIRRRAL